MAAVAAAAAVVQQPDDGERHPEHLLHAGLGAAQLLLLVLQDGELVHGDGVGGGGVDGDVGGAGAGGGGGGPVAAAAGRAARWHGSWRGGAALLTSRLLKLLWFVFHNDAALGPICRRRRRPGAVSLLFFLKYVVPVHRPRAVRSVV